jgi:hypothetical protein
MEPDSWRATHDWNAKVILGVNFPAGRDASKELDAVVDVLMNHPNIAPFVSLRLIQHLVTSDPSPQYIARVGQVFRNNGAGVAGDMKAVIRAILLDPEARQGDRLDALASTRIGKIREPLSWYVAALRGLDCKKALRYSEGGVVQPNQQNALSPATVFGFYLPTDRAPGSNLLAPEQKLLNTSELSSRFGGWALSALNDPLGTNNDAGCQIDDLTKMLERSPREFVDSLNLRYFRGAMPPLLRTSILDLAAGQNTLGQFASTDDDLDAVRAEFTIVWGDQMNRRDLFRRGLALPLVGGLGATGLSGLLTLPGVAAANRLPGPRLHPLVWRQ